MTARLPFTQAAVRRAISAARKEGLRVVEIKPDGTVVVSVDNPRTPVLPEAPSVQNKPASEWEDVGA